MNMTLLSVYEGYKLIGRSLETKVSWFNLSDWIQGLHGG